MLVVLGVEFIGGRPTRLPAAGAVDDCRLPIVRHKEIAAGLVSRPAPTVRPGGVCASVAGLLTALRKVGDHVLILLSKESP